MPLINCKIELDLTWSINCVISEISRTVELAANPSNLARGATETNGSRFTIKTAKLYVSAFTLSINDTIKSLENIKQGFKITISSNKYSSEITKHLKNNNLGYMIDPIFSNINKMFVPSFKNANDNQDFLLISVTCY